LQFADTHARLRWRTCGRSEWVWTQGFESGKEGRDRVR
jgi:hypothetical protein